MNGSPSATLDAGPIGRTGDETFRQLQPFRPSASTLAVMDEVIHALKAAGEPTRLRILVTLDRSELTVSELCRILGQSQPRVSRHLKLLCEAGLLVRQAEGANAYYRRARTPLAEKFFAGLLPLVDDEDPAALHDRHRLAQVRADRAELAARSAEKVAAEEEHIRHRRVPVEAVDAAMLEIAADLPTTTLIDVGTGTGRVLQLFGPQVESGVGVELSKEMLNLARTRLEDQGLTNCSVRHGNAYDLGAGVAPADLVVLHHVLRFLDEPATAVAQAAETVRPGGGLLIVDFAPHYLVELQESHGHRRLGFADGEIGAWCEAAGLAEVSIRHLTPSPAETEITPEERLTVTIWLARSGSTPTRH